MTKNSLAVLHPVTFGARRCHRNDGRLHSHLGEEFFGDWAMNKGHHMLFGQCFVWTTGCYAIKFILFYNGANPAILRLQMHLMCWNINIIRNDHYTAAADYWTWLGVNLCFDPLFKAYLELTQSLRWENPPPSSFPMQPENMPYYRGPHVTTPPDDTVDTADAVHCQAIVSTLLIDNCCRQIWQVRESNSTNSKGTGSTQWWIPMLCSAGSPIQCPIVDVPPSACYIFYLSTKQWCRRYIKMWHST